MRFIYLKFSNASYNSFALASWVHAYPEENTPRLISSGLPNPRAHWGLFHYLSASCAAALLQIHCYLGGYASSVLVIQKKPYGLSQLLLKHLCGGGGVRLIPAVRGGSGPHSGQGAPWGQVGLLLGAGLGCPPAIPTQAGAWGGGIGHHPAQHALGKLVEKLFQQLVGVCLWRKKN